MISAAADDYDRDEAMVMGWMVRPLCSRQRVSHNLHGTARREAATSIPNIPTDPRALPPSRSSSSSSAAINPNLTPCHPPSADRWSGPAPVWTRAGQAGCLSRLPALLLAKRKKGTAVARKTAEKKNERESVSGPVQSSPVQSQLELGLVWMTGRPGGWVTRDYRRQGTQQLG